MLDRLLPWTTRRGRWIRTIVWRAPERGNPGMELDRWASETPRAFFVQIGSNNGVTSDPLVGHIDTQPGWNGILVEPVPAYFDELTRHRGGDPRLRLVQAAITSHDTPTVAITAVVPNPSLPSWTHGLSTLHPEVALRHQSQLTELKLMTVDVPALTFDELTSDVARIDLLHIDTEGHDAEILDQVDLDRWQPGFVMFEHKHLDWGTRRRLRSRLRTHGYVISWNESDTVAVRR